jgi:aspartate/tyrosine/aromatic aminotransferase
LEGHSKDSRLIEQHTGISIQQSIEKGFPAYAERVGAAAVKVVVTLQESARHVENVTLSKVVGRISILNHSFSCS